MTLPTSGAISLNQMHVEAGGSSGTIASINDADIRALIGKGSGVTMSFNEWYGASGWADSQTLTIGVDNSGAPYVGPSYGFRNWTSPTYGSMADGTCNFYFGAAYNGCRIWLLNATNKFVYLTIAGNRGSTGSAWNTMLVDSYPYSRTNATRSYNSASNVTTWEWAIGTSTTNPFGTTTGATKSVTFT